jgi:hypothetical protein
MAFPAKGDRVAHGQYGPGTIVELDVYHTVIDFDAHGTRRFVTSKVVLERTSDQGPTAAERRVASPERARAAKAEARAEAKARAKADKAGAPKPTSPAA